MPEITWINIVFIYVITWSILVFAVLPLGIEREEDVGKGHSVGAPKNARLKQKLIITTAVSVLVTCGIVALLSSGAIPVRAQ